MPSVDRRHWWRLCGWEESIRHSPRVCCQTSEIFLTYLSVVQKPISNGLLPTSRLRGSEMLRVQHAPVGFWYQRELQNSRLRRKAALPRPLGGRCVAQVAETSALRRPRACVHSSLGSFIHLFQLSFVFGYEFSSKYPSHRSPTRLKPERP